jgi:hypothetical protein
MTRLVIGETTTGRGLARRTINVVLDADEKVIARFDVSHFRQGAAHEYVRGHEACMAEGEPCHPDEMTHVVETCGTPPFTSTMHRIEFGGRVMAATSSADDLAAWRQGWLRAMKERGLLTRKGAIRRDARNIGGSSSV